MKVYDKLPPGQRKQDIQKNILTFVNHSLILSRKNKMQGVSTDSKTLTYMYELLKKRNSQYYKLELNSDSIIILRQCAREAKQDLIDGNYSQSVKNLLNEFYEMFYQCTQTKAFNRFKTLSKVIERKEINTEQIEKPIEIEENKMNVITEDGEQGYTIDTEPLVNNKVQVHISGTIKLYDPRELKIV